MEHTKGKFEAMPYTRRDGDNIRWVKAVKGKKQAICQTFKPNAEANAKELVRRWNAFEKDGLVDGLRAACDEGLAECERVKMDCKCKWKNLDSLLGRIERIEAAIAKAKA